MGRRKKIVYVGGPPGPTGPAGIQGPPGGPMAESADELLARLEHEYSHTATLTGEQMARMDLIRSRFLSVAKDVAALCPNNRARSIALTELQTAKMFAVQAIVDEKP